MIRSFHFSLPFRIIILFAIFPLPTFSQIDPNKKVDEIISEGVQQILLQNYPAADSIFSHIKWIEKNNPMSELMHASVMISKVTDFEDELDKTEFEKLLNSAEEKIENNSIHNSRKKYYYGLLHGFRAFAGWYQGNWFKTFTEGYRALNFFEAYLENERDANDAQIAIGIYKYWRSRKSEILSWLPFLSDEKPKGIAMIEKGLSGETYFKHLAMHSLAWIYIDYKTPIKAIKICEDILAKYPENRFFLWAIARAYEEIDLKKSVIFYSKLLQSIRNAKMNGYNEIVVLHILAQKNFEIGSYEGALKNIENIYSINLEASVRERLAARFNKISSLRKSIYELTK